MRIIGPVLRTENRHIQMEMGDVFSGTKSTSAEFSCQRQWLTFLSKVSADVLSQQLIMPLISVTHLAFTSADPVSELSQTDLEKVCARIAFLLPFTKQISSCVHSLWIKLGEPLVGVWIPTSNMP